MSWECNPCKHLVFDKPIVNKSRIIYPTTSPSAHRVNKNVYWGFWGIQEKLFRNYLRSLRLLYSIKLLSALNQFLKPSWLSPSGRLSNGNPTCRHAEPQLAGQVWRVTTWGAGMQGNNLLDRYAVQQPTGQVCRATTC